MAEPVPHPTSVHVTSSDRYVQEIQARQHALRSDEPRSAGGDDTGPTPKELLLGGLAACTAITLRMYAQRKGWELGELQVDLTLLEDGGAMRVERRIGFGAQLPEEAVRRLLEIAEKTPVTKMVRGEVLIETRVG